MFGKTVFFLKTILLWGLLTATLIEAGRQKKDVHHMIFLNESKRPSKSQRHRGNDHHDYHIDDRPKKSRKKQEEKKPKQPTSIEESVEDINGSYEEFLTHKPKSKRHPQQHNRHSERYHKRHNSHRHHDDYKRHHKINHNNHKKSKPKQSHNLPVPDNWIPMTSKEFFEKEKQIQYYQGNGLGQYSQGLIQSIPLEITTPQTLGQLGDFHNTQSTIVYPSLSFLNQKVQNSPQPQLPPIEPYKPFDYSVLEPKLQNLKSNEAIQEQEVASSDVVNVKYNEGKRHNPLSIIVANSHENQGSNEMMKHKQKEKKNHARVEADKSKKITVKGARIRGGSRYSIRSKN